MPRRSLDCGQGVPKRVSCDIPRSGAPRALLASRQRTNHPLQLTAGGKTEKHGATSWHELMLSAKPWTHVVPAVKEMSLSVIEEA